MTTCPACGRPVSGDPDHCTCGAPLPGDITRTIAVSHPASNPASLTGRFVAGAMLAAGRYRIVNLLGRGGMGEVYQAEDLKLRQMVALKFLPSAAAFDAGMLARFHNEVRIARQVAHQNVCRVYDIGEEDGLHFLSMEFIDGEDLASLLRRIGRLPGDKAAEIGRQICAGLAAAHEQGVLHRDLKPANIMIDGRGKARVTDFGLAVVTEEVRGDDAMSGTPAYMAPEQLAGQASTARSDIYALGLVLYELFTGRKVFEARTWQEFCALHQSSTPATPSSLVKDIDSLAERVILRCLEKDPAQRPASATQVGLALPDGDPLQAALAAGETPSPEMVAAAPKSGSLPPAIALACLAVTWSLIALFLFYGRSQFIHSRMPLRKSPEVLAERAAELTRTLGYPDEPADRVFGLGVDRSYWEYAKTQPATPEFWKRLETGQPLSIFFWYRQGPQTLAAKGFFTGDVSLPDPPQDVPGMVSLILDPKGRLVEFSTVPPQVDPPDPGKRQTDWKPLFDAAGLAIASFTPVVPQWNPSHFADSRQAWTGVHPDHPLVPLRVEAADWRGQAVYFRVVAPWDRPNREPAKSSHGENKASDWLAVGLVIVVALGAILLARHNLRQKQADTRGALKVSVLLMLLTPTGMLLRAHHVPGLGEFAILRDVAGVTLMSAAAAWVFYVALESFVRRYWPNLLVGWTRLLAGDYRDPMVGRDVLLGGLLALIGHTLVIYLGYDLSRRLGMEAVVAFAPVLNWREVASQFLMSVPAAVVYGLFMLLFLLLAYVLVRREWAAALIVALLYYAYIAVSFAFTWPFYFLLVIQAICAIGTLWRFGLLAMIIYQVYFVLSYQSPLTPDLSLWYSGASYTLMGALVVLSGIACYVSLGERKLFNSRLLDD